MGDTRERDRLNLILENVADPILVTDDRSDIILMNDQAEQLFQRRSGTGRRARRQIAAIQDNDTKFTTFISEFPDRQAEALRERRCVSRTPSRPTSPMEVVSGKIRTSAGRPIAIVSVLHDLTKQVENERLYDALKRLNSELEATIRGGDGRSRGRRTRDCSGSRKRSRRRTSSNRNSSPACRTSFVRRSTRCIGYTALMLDRSATAKCDRRSDGCPDARIARRLEHLLELISDILDLAGSKPARCRMHVVEVDVRDVVREVAQQIEPMVRKKSLTS